MKNPISLVILILLVANCAFADDCPSVEQLTASRSNTLVVAVTKDGQFYMGPNNQFNLDNFAIKVHEIIKHDPSLQNSVFLKPSEGVPSSLVETAKKNLKAQGVLCVNVIAIQRKAPIKRD